MEEESISKDTPMPSRPIPQEAFPTLKEMVQLVVAVFHDHVTMLETYWNAALNPVMTILGPNPFHEPGVPTIEEVGGALAGPTRDLLSRVETFQKRGDTDWAVREIPGDLTAEVEKQRIVISSFINASTPGPHRFINLQSSARKLVEVMEELKKLKILPRETIRAISASAEDVERICCFYHLLQVEDRVTSLQQEAGSLRDVLLSELTATPVPKPVMFSRVLSQTIAALEPMATRKRVELRMIGNVSNDVLINAVEKDIKRAIANLLSNAIKYSWTLPRDKWAWVDIRAGCDKDTVFVEFENWGVPIDQDDIDSGRIFGFLERGRFSSDRSRTGTGIGLWDSSAVAERHGGKVSLTTRPARTGDELSVNTPHLTVARLELPRLK